jgi:predicted Zn-dependent protease
MLQPSAVQRIIPILKKNARRALKMRVQGFPSPYYCSFLLKDFETFVTSAGSGSLYKRKHDRERIVFNDLRVGSYRYDQTTEGGLTDNNHENESYQYATVPIDDLHYDGLSLALWRLSECKYREAVSDYNHKNALRLSLVDQNSDLHSFVQLRPHKKILVETPERIDSHRWQRICKDVSAWIASFPGIFDSTVEFEAEQSSSVFVSSEGSTIVQHRQVFTLSASIRHLNKDGSQLSQDFVLNVATQKELPSVREFKNALLEKYYNLQQLVKAEKIHSFTGPVLLFPKPAGLLLHEAIGHRLEGSRLLSNGEGQTFKGQISKRILPVDISIIDDPSRKRFQDTRCLASYAFDDEGSPGQKAVLVEKGILKGFLSTRSALMKKNFVPNGHARNRGYERPISRMSVFEVKGERTYAHEQLREMLIREIKKQRVPFGMIVYETSGGETDTSSYDFQAFSGEISFATLLFPDGREVPVRGVNFVGTPLQALANIVALGDTQEVENHYCGAESGFIPVTTISPAMLLKSLELQAKDEELVTQHILPKPKRYRKRKPRNA